MVGVGVLPLVTEDVKKEAGVDFDLDMKIVIEEVNMNMFDVTIVIVEVNMDMNVNLLDTRTVIEEVDIVCMIMVPIIN